jgi:hypothetical protein
MGPQALANISWAAAKLGCSPSPAFTRLLFSVSQLSLPKFKPQEVVNLGWAVATLRLKPPPGWTDAWLAAAARCWGDMTPQGLSMSAWAVASLSEYSLVSPESVTPWLTGLEGVARPQLGRWSPHSTSLLLWSYAQLGVRPGRGMLRAALSYTRHQLPASATAPTDLSTLLYALAAMRYRPPARWVGVWLRAAGGRLAGFSVRELSNLLWSLGRLQVGGGGGREGGLGGSGSGRGRWFQRR